MAKKLGKGVIEVRGRYRPRKIICTGLFIRSHLLECGEDYPFNMWRALKEAKKEAKQKVGSYQNFRNFISQLLRLGLIKFTREEPSQNPHFQPRRYYTYVPQSIDKVELWRNPRRALYPETWEKHH